MHATAEEIIEALGLEALTVEGGSFKETYRSRTKALCEGKGERCAGTCIYYLLRAGEKSRWHKVASDEIWLYHAGSPATQLLLFPDGSWTERTIGPDILSGQRPQSLIEAGTWQAATLLDGSPDAWGLFGALVTPGFEYGDFTEGDGRLLGSRHPQAKRRMEELGLL